MTSMNGKTIETGQSAYIALADGREIKATLIVDGDKLFAAVKSLGSDYGLIRVDPAKTYII